MSIDYIDLAKKIAPSVREKPTAIAYHCNYSIEDMKKKTALVVGRAKVDFDKRLEIVYAGTLGENYDIPTLLDALIIAEKKLNLNIIVRVAGDGPLRSKIESHIKNKLSQNIEYVGRLDSEQIDRFYINAEVALVTYAKNSTVSMPAKSYELMLFELPVITSLAREYGKLVEDCNFGFKYSAGDALSLANALQLCIANRHKLKSMGSRALILTKNFDRNIQLNKYLNVVKAVSANLSS